MEGVTRGLARMMPCGQAREGTRGKSTLKVVRSVMGGVTRGLARMMPCAMWTATCPISDGRSDTWSS